VNLHVLAAGLLAGLIPAIAWSQEQMPAYDPVRSCIETARRAGARADAPPPGCVQSETDARDAAAPHWPGLSASARARCKRLADRRQSYLILGSCVEQEARKRP